MFTWSTRCRNSETPPVLRATVLLISSWALGMMNFIPLLLFTHTRGLKIAESLALHKPADVLKAERDVYISRTVNFSRWTVITSSCHSTGTQIVLFSSHSLQGSAALKTVILGQSRMRSEPLWGYPLKISLKWWFYKTAQSEGFTAIIIIIIWENQLMVWKYYGCNFSIKRNACAASS